jgi:hypothetical protein
MIPTEVSRNCFGLVFIFSRVDEEKDWKNRMDFLIDPELRERRFFPMDDSEFWSVLVCGISAVLFLVSVFLLYAEDFFIKKESSPIDASGARKRKL